MSLFETIKNLPSIWYVFSFLSVLTLFGALGTIMSKNPIHSVIYLILTFFSLSAHYVLLNAQFLAAVNIIVYAGAIMVLFLFVIMFLNMKKEEEEMKRSRTIAFAVGIGIVLGGLLILYLRKADREYPNVATFNSQTGMIETLGALLYKDYMFPFEVISVLLLVALVGAVMLGKREAGERHF